MIYLIDDKKLRQEIDFGWKADKFNNLNKLLIPIYTLEEIENKADEIFRKENTVIYHESFLDNSTLNKQSVFKRFKLEQFAKNDSSFKLVIFSGSKNSRSVDGNIAHLPVSVVYKNLNIFVERNSDNSNSLKYLAFGDNPDIESELLEKLEIANAQIEKEPIENENLNCLFIPTYDKYIHNPIKGATISEFYDQESDEDITEYISKNLSQNKFENIFIPLCYGNTLSDYNGLRLATHIRCTESFNQLSRIYIYGFVGIDYLYQNEYFNILKTKNVFLIPYSKHSFVKYASNPPSRFLLEELPEHVAKLKLDIPHNYEDNHSIANEWAIYRWSESINADDEHIDKIVQKINTNIYFKYLKLLYPISKNHLISNTDLKIEYSGNPKILYIDDEAEKGWFEIFCNILTDKNGLTFEYLDEEFVSKTQDEIIKSAIDKIIKSNIDLVILDFRLHPNDFATTIIDEVTGFILLKSIKKLNPGIQVIIFSATNKVLNLQALQDAGADAFIFKGTFENPQNDIFTKRQIQGFIASIQYCLKNIYLKEIELFKKEIQLKFDKNPLIRYYPNDQRCLRGLQYQCLLLIELNSICDILNSRNENRFNHAMLMQFKIIECIIEIFIPEKGKKSKWLFYDKTDVKYFYTDDGKLYDTKSVLFFYDNNVNRKVEMIIPTYEYNSTRNKIDCLIEQKLNIVDKKIIHKKVKELVNYRNSFIHPRDRVNLYSLTSDQIVEWMSIINQIISKI